MTIDFGAHLGTESARFAAAMADADPRAAVPTCPDWTAADLLWHLTEVQSFWAAIVRDRLDDPESAEVEPERPADYAELLARFEASSAALARTLADTPDDVGVWTWFAADQSAGFVRRRQAHEALIHRLDAELTAATDVTELDAGLATDGVAEVFEWMYGAVPAWAEHRVDGPVGRVSTVDTAADWLVQLGRWSGVSPNTGKTYAGEVSLSVVDRSVTDQSVTDQSVIAAGRPAFEVSGRARDLDAWLWNRPTRDAVTLEGDYTQFVQLIRSGVQ